MRESAHCCTFPRMLMRNSIVCHNCDKLQDKINNLEQNNLLLRNQLTQRDDALVGLYAIVTEQAQENQHLKESNQSLNKLLFGSKSENGTKLKNKSGANANNNNSGNGNDNNNKKNKKSNKPPNRSNSRKLSKNLPIVIKKHTLPPGEDVCKCCGKQLEIITHKISKQLDIVPAILQVLEHHRAQYVCPDKCKGSMKLSSLPLGHSANTLATPHLISWLAVNKYDYHLPLYRQTRMLKTSGYDISNKTIDSWILNTAFDLKPIVTRLIDKLIAQSHLFSDDTTTKTITPGINKTKTTRLWVYTSKEIPIVIYDFTTSREGKHPQEFLKNFKGYLQTDAYAAYYALYEDEHGKLVIIPVFCMAHCRRNFFEIAELTESFGLADEALEYITKLYAIEDEIRSLSNDERHQQRQERSIPILTAFNAWLQYSKSIALPGSKLDKAINYALNHWTELTNYCLDGRLEIDNNRAERKMRSPKLGMSNYLFYGSERGGHAAAIYLSLIETCKENNISPYLWLADVIPKLRHYKSSQLDELLPLANHWSKHYDAILKQQAA